MKSLQLKKNTPLFLLVIICFTLTSCASIVNGSNQKVSFSSKPEGANIKIYDSMGKLVQESTTPDTIKLKRGSDYMEGADYKIIITSTDGNEKTVYLKSKMSGWYVGNIIFGGLIGMLWLDPETGGMWKLDPKKVDVDFNSSAKNIKILNKELTIAVINNTPQHLKNKLIKIN